MLDVRFVLQTPTRSSPAMFLPSQGSSQDERPKEAIWTKQVVELPPIMAKNQKTSPASMMFDDGNGGKFKKRPTVVF